MAKKKKSSKKKVSKKTGVKKAAKKSPKAAKPKAPSKKPVSISPSPATSKIRDRASLEFYAAPYAYDGTGFYFETAEDFEEGMQNSPHEEFQIQFINGSDEEADFFRLVKPDPGNIADFIEFIDTADPHDIRAAAYLIDDIGKSFEDAIQQADDVSMFEGSPKDYIYEYIDEIGIEGIKGDYFDYDYYGRDIRISGDATNHLDDDLETAENDLKSSQDARESDDDDDDYDDYEKQEEIDRLKQEIARIDNLSDYDLGYEIVDQLGGVEELSKETLATYFDYDQFARDAEINGDIARFSFGGTDYVVTNANEF